MSNIVLATKTIAAIDAAIKADQGAKFRTFLRQVLPHISDAYRGEEEGFRSHMGASGIGRECARVIWYDFHWAAKPKFTGRMTRLFNRGHMEEGRFIAMLLLIGCQVFQQDANGNQFRISHAGGHFGGSGDGVIVELPDLLPGTPALGEFKTHGEKSFIELAGKAVNTVVNGQEVRIFEGGKGVREAKFEHYVQMQMYMRKMGLAVGLYLAVNKNTDDLYGEIVTLDPILADIYLDRAQQIIFFDNGIPKKLNESPGFFKCKFCDKRGVCHQKAPVEINCRTCQFSIISSDGGWYCGKVEALLTKENSPLTKEQQLAGCSDYKVKPELC